MSYFDESDYSQRPTRSTVPGAAAVGSVRRWVDARGIIHHSDSGGDELFVPSVAVFHNTNQSIADNTLTALAFNSERWDTDDMHSTSVNTSRLTCVIPGMYFITGNAAFVSNTTGLRNCHIRLNGSTLITFDSRNPISGAPTLMVVSTQYRLAVGDYVELTVFQNSTGSLNAGFSPNAYPEFRMTWIGNAP